MDDDPEIRRIRLTLVGVVELPDPDWYLDNVLVHAEPGMVAPVRPGPVALWTAWWARTAELVRARWPALAGAAGTQGFCLTSRQLSELGVSRERVRTAVSAGEWAAPCRGVVAVVGPKAIGADSPSPWIRRRREHATQCAAAALLNPGHAVAARGSAIVLGLPTGAIPSIAELSCVDGHRNARRRARTGTTSPAECTRWYGVTLHGVARTVVDLARHDRGDGLMAGDAALRESLVAPEDLCAALRSARRWPGVAQAREIVALMSPLAESALESLVRLALHDAGLPAPRLQVEITVPGRRSPYRVDMLWPEARLVLEVDGREKYSNDELWSEKRREAALRRSGYRVERVMRADLGPGTWEATCAMLREALGEQSGRLV